MKNPFSRSVKNKAPPMARTGYGYGNLALGSGNPETYMRAFGSVGTLFAIVDALAENVAAINWHLYRKNASGQKRDRVEVFEHPAIALWLKPNDHMDSTEFVETSQQHFDLIGETVWYVGRSVSGLGPPLELWPIRPDRVTPVPDPDNFIQGYLYHCPGVEPMPWRPEDVIRIKRPNPIDPYRGMGAVQSIMVDIYGEQAAAEWNANFFRNSAEPGGVVEFDSVLDDAEWKEFQERWNEQHLGTSNAHRVAFLERAHWKDRAFSNRDMQFAQLREVASEVIRRAFRFPRPMLGDVQDINRANAEAGEVVFGRYLLTPRAERIKKALNTKLLPLYGTAGKGLEFDYDEPVPEDAAAESREKEVTITAVGTLVDAGFDPADVLEWAGLPAMGYIGARPLAAPANALSAPSIVLVSEARCTRCNRKTGENINVGAGQFCPRCKADYTVT